MIRTIGATLAALLAWVAFAGLIILLFRHGWADYAAAYPTKGYTLPMMLARLTDGAVASVIAGAVAARIGSGKAIVWTASVLFVVSLVYHISIWQDYPAWYHLVYLGYLIPLTLLGGRLIRNKPA